MDESKPIKSWRDIAPTIDQMDQLATEESDADGVLTMRRTVAACAWLIAIAEVSVERHGWDPAIVRWLDQMGTSMHSMQQDRVQ